MYDGPLEVCEGSSGSAGAVAALLLAPVVVAAASISFYGPLEACDGSSGIADAGSALLSAPVAVEAVEAQAREPKTEAEAEVGRRRTSVVDARRRHKAEARVAL